MLLVATTGALGPSAASPPLPGAGALPPYELSIGPSAWLVTALLVAAVASGTAGSVLSWRAVRAGWAPRPSRLLLCGAAAVALVALVPPIGSADPLSYAAYGRAAATGSGPYTTTPAELAARGDRVAAAVEEPWRDTPSVYGPVATAEQALVGRVAGDSVRTAVTLLGLLNALAFLGTGLVLDRLAGSDVARRRAALLWTLNPLLLLQLVAGAHIDALLVLPAVLAVAAVRQRPLVAGVLVGLAGGVKLTGGLVGAGLAWTCRSRPRALVALVAGAVLVLLPGYLAVGGLDALAQPRRASRFVSRATPWRPVTSLLEQGLDDDVARALVGLLALGLALALAVLLARSLPSGSSAVSPAARAAAVAVLAWLLATPYALPWYDGLAWALLALLPWSAYDGLLLARTTMLSLAYLPGRVVPLPDALDRATDVLRSGIAPVVMTALLVATVVVSRGRLRAPAPR